MPLPIIIPKAFMLAALTACPAKPPPVVDVRFSGEMTRYSEQYPSSALRTLLAKDKDSTLATDRRATVFGVTSGNVAGRLQVSYNTLTWPDGNQCLYVDRATFIITYTPSVYVSSQIRDMACSYKVTREHEQQHVSIDYKVLQDYLPYIKSDMLKYLAVFGVKGFGPYPKAQSDRYRDELTAQIMAAGEPMIEKLRAARRKEQGTIDTPENYKRESDKCPGDKPAIAKKFGGGR